MSRVSDAAAFGKVAVIYGGDSVEREISILTGAAVVAALQDKNVNATGIDTRETPVTDLPGAGFDRVWVALHGTGGEDGRVQGVLEAIGLPYTGSGVLGSALAMDKRRSKMLFEAAGLMTPQWMLVRTENELAAVPQTIGLPCVVKPAGEGSSVGVTRVDERDALLDAWRTAAFGDNDVVVERLVDGPEYTAGILDGEVLPLIHIETPRAFYDYKAKYFSDRTEYHCPCGLPAGQEQELAAASLTAFEVVGASGWGRVDFMLDTAGNAFFFEVNTIPGLTSHSLVPMAAAQAGIDFVTLVWRVLETSFDRGEVT